MPPARTILPPSSVSCARRFRPRSLYAVGRAEATFIGASPELLIRREGQRASTVALAGSTRRSADPAVDDHLGEQLLRSDKDRDENAIVARRIARTLSPYSVWVTAAREPVVVKVANIQHLAAPIRAQLASPIGAIELAGRLHPTPAVGGEPRDGAERDPGTRGTRPRLVRRRRWAGPTPTGDGEFCVALRCALLRGARRDAATPAAGSSPTPTRRRSWPRPRSSSRRCCRCWPAERPPRTPASADAAVQGEVLVSGRCAPR